MRILISFLLILAAFKYSSGQNYLLPNEKIIFSFTAVNNKKMVLAKDSTDAYIIYRFGKPDKIELEYPEKTKASWSKFTYSYYLRGGGQQNEGLDLNYVYFRNDHFKYIIYNTYSAGEGKSTCGIKVMDTLTMKTVDVRGKINTIKGNLIDFRDNNLLKISDETFE